MRRLLLALTVLFAPNVAAAQAVVEMPWARATAPAAMSGAAYMTVTAASDDRITSVTTPAAATAELHETIEQNGVMKMEARPDMPLTGGKPLTMKPGSFHVMLLGLKAPLKQGDSFRLTVTFEKSPPISVDVKVEAAGAAGPGAHSH